MSHELDSGIEIMIISAQTDIHVRSLDLLMQGKRASLAGFRIWCARAAVVLYWGDGGR